MLKYICLSDQHAGALTSLLTPLTHLTPEGVSPVTTAFAEAFDGLLAAQSARPQLILLGDLLDLQFSDGSRAAMAGLAHLTALAEGGRLDKTLIATAGNHDHSLWSDARMGQEVRRALRPEPGFAHRKATAAFSGDPLVQSRMLTEIAHLAGFDAVDLRYPNIGLGDTGKAVVLHHGHFVERPYRMMSDLKDFLGGTQRRHLTAEAVAAENAGWLDFFWASLGETGLSGEAYDLYQNLLTAAGFRSKSAEWTDLVAERLADALPLSGNLAMRAALKRATRVGFDASLGAVLDTERRRVIDPLSTDGWEGLHWYLDGVVRSQVAEELGGDVADLTFVFGHTHKPFADRVVSDASLAPVKVFNTGGWTLNGVRHDTAAGAAMVLISEDLDVVSLRFMGTPQQGEVLPVYIEQLGGTGFGANQFAMEVARWVAASAPAWENLTEVVGEAYGVRQKMLLAMTDPGRVA